MAFPFDPSSMNSWRNNSSMFDRNRLTNNQYNQPMSSIPLGYHDTLGWDPGNAGFGGMEGWLNSGNASDGSFLMPGTQGPAGASPSGYTAPITPDVSSIIPKVGTPSLTAPQAVPGNNPGFYNSLMDWAGSSAATGGLPSVSQFADSASDSILSGYNTNAPKTFGQKFADGDYASTMQGIGSILGGVSSLGSMYTGFKGMGLAKDQFNFQKNSYNENMANSRADYNRRLESIYRQNAQAGGALSQQYKTLDEYMKAHGLKDPNANKKKKKNR